jgi:hypothetical protein
MLRIIHRSAEMKGGFLISIACNNPFFEMFADSKFP